VSKMEKKIKISMIRRDHIKTVMKKKKKL